MHACRYTSVEVLFARLSHSLVAEQEIQELTGSAAMHLARSWVGSTRDLSNSFAYDALHLKEMRADSHNFTTYDALSAIAQSNTAQALCTSLLGSFRSLLQR